MPTVRSSGLLRDVASIPCADEALRQRGRYRRDAIDLVEREICSTPPIAIASLPLDEPPSDVLRAGGEALDALRLVPESGQLTAVGVGVCTLGPALEQRASALFAERRMSLALALDKLGNELLFALSRRVQDRIVVEARNAAFDGGRRIAGGRSGPAARGTERRAASGRRRRRSA